MNDYPVRIIVNFTPLTSLNFEIMSFGKYLCIDMLLFLFVISCALEKSSRHLVYEYDGGDTKSGTTSMPSDGYIHSTKRIHSSMYNANAQTIIPDKPPRRRCLLNR